MKKLIRLAVGLLIPICVMADTPPPSSLTIKGATTSTGIGNVTDSLKVNVTNIPSSQAVTGTFWQATQPVSIASMPSISGTVSVSNFPSTQPVSGTFWQATQPVSIATMPSTPVTGTFWQATQPVSSGQLPASLGAKTTANSMSVNIASDQTVPVSGTFWQATQPVSGTVSVGNFPSTQTVGQSTGSNLHTVVDSGSVTASISGTVPVSGTFWQSTQPVSLASVPLASGAATSALQTQISGQLPTALGAKTTANSMAVNIASDQTVPVSGTFWQATQPVSGTFWQATQPVSIASMPTTPVTGTFWQSTQPVSGTFWQATQPVSIASMPSTPVTGTFWQATQPVSATQLPAALGQTTMSASLPVTLASNQSSLSVTDATGVLAQGSKAAGTAATNSVLTGLVYNSTVPALTNGQQVAMQSDLNGNLQVVQQDLNFTGQSAQTALINNIIPATAGASATNATGFRSASIQLLSTGTAGGYILEGSNDNTTFVTIPMWNQLILTGTAITAAVVPTASTIIYTFPITTQFIRLRISTAVTGGSIQAFTHLSPAAWEPPVRQVGNGTAANLNANIGTLPALTAGTNNIGLVGTGGSTGVANAPVYNAYGTTSITTSAYTQLIASTTSATNFVDIFDSSGQAMILATGASGSEVILAYVPPGGAQIRVQIAASTRIAYKALTASATTGYLTMNLWK